MKIKIIKSNMDKIKQMPIGIHRDTDLIGFAISVGKSKQSYIIDKRLGGKIIRKVIGNVGALTPDQARKQAQVLLGDMAKGINIVEVAKKERIKGVTLKEAYDEYVSTKKLAQSTITGYNTAMNTVFKDWHNKPLNQITGDMVVKVFKTKSVEKPYAANLYFRYLRAVFNFAIENYSVGDTPLLHSNPCNKINRLKIWNKTTRRTRHITQEQLKDFFEGLSIKSSDRPQKQLSKKQCMVILFTGCRDQEIARLQSKNIDFKSGTITIETTKNHLKHVLPYGKWLGNYLKELCDGLAPDDYIFPSDKNKVGHLKDHRKAIKEIAKDCGIEFSLHDLRRTFASIANNYITGMTQYTLKKLLNHAEDDVTAGYIQFDPEVLRKPMQDIEDFILTKVGIDKDNAKIF